MEAKRRSIVMGKDRIGWGKVRGGIVMKRREEREEGGCGDLCRCGHNGCLERFRICCCNLHRPHACEDAA